MKNLSLWEKIGMFVGIIFLAFAIFYINGLKGNELNQVACTTDAKICPDGSAVGRTAPNCEFAPCPAGNIISVIFVCDGEKNIDAKFYSENDTKVDLSLSDGRELSVPHAFSASGARYANTDESFVFWNKGDAAFITEGIGSAQKTTYANCTIQK